MNIPQESHYHRFQEIFTNYYSSLCNYAFSFVKNDETCEDIVQEVFARIWENKRELLATDNIRFYLFTAVRNNCITHLRREKKTGTIELNDNLSLNEPHISPTPGEKHNPPDYETLLQQAIQLLPPKCREIFIMSRMGNMRYKEIAGTLGISVKTVENQLSKAFKLMREFLKDKGIHLAWLGAVFFF